MSDMLPGQYHGFPSGRPGSSAHPEVIRWFKVYALAMAALYALFVLLAALVLFAGFFADDVDEVEMIIIGVVMGGLGIVFMIAFGIAVFLPPKPWVWIYDMVLIAIGLTSCLTMVASIPLLIYWIKPETKAYFGRS